MLRTQEPPHGYSFRCLVRRKTCGLMVLVMSVLYSLLQLSTDLMAGDPSQNTGEFQKEFGDTSSEGGVHLGDEHHSKTSPSGERDWKSPVRSQRFPGVEERVKIYMSSWYYPPCAGSTRARYRYSNVSSDSHSLPLVTLHENATRPGLGVNITSFIQGDMLLLLRRNAVVDCAHSESHGLRDYCHDSLDMLNRFEASSNLSAAPLLVHFGDGRMDYVLARSVPEEQMNHIVPIPYFSKFRAMNEAPKTDIHGSEICRQFHKGPHVEFPSPIIWKLHTRRHWYELTEARSQDVPWDYKMNAAVWRGALTGQIDENATDVGLCAGNLRCNFVLRHEHSSLIDAKLTAVDATLRHRSAIARKASISNVLTYRKQQRFKILISLEGNDIATGLKWQLLSESVLLMPEPTRTSWAMEELLEPWIHYVPLNKDGSNAEEMVKWVLYNDEKAHQIAKQATVFMEDMVYHPDAAQDEALIQQEILQRYRKLWS